MRMLYNELTYANVGIKVEVYIAWESKKGSIALYQLFMDQNVSQVFHLSPNLYFMKSRNLSYKEL